MDKKGKKEKEKHKKKSKKVEQIVELPASAFLKERTPSEVQTEEETLGWGGESEWLPPSQGNVTLGADSPQRDNQAIEDETREEAHSPQGGTQLSVSVACEEECTITQRMAKVDQRFFQALVQLASKMGGDEEATVLVNKVLNNFSLMKTIAMEATQEVHTLQGKVEILRERESRSYSEVAKEAPKDKGERREEEKRNEVPRKKAEAIILLSESLDAEKLTKLIQENIDPCQVGLKNVAMRKSREGVIITSTSPESIARLEEELKTNAATRDKVATRRPRKRLPKIKIVNIPEDMPVEELTERMVQQNELNCSADDMAIVTTWKGRSGTTAIVELNKRGFEALQNRNRIFIQWTSCPFYDSTFVPRCTNCARTGHLERECSNSSRCTECAGDHHHRNCSASTQRCSACQEAGVPDAEKNHSFMSFRCPVFRNRQIRETNSLVDNL